MTTRYVMLATFQLLLLLTVAIAGGKGYSVFAS